MDKKKWYMITTISGREENVLESIKNRVASERLDEIFEDFKVITIPYLTPREKKKYLLGEAYKIRNKSLFPGYIFVKMIMTNEAWFMVRNTQYVTGLVGSSGQRAKPTPVSDLEMRKIEKKVAQLTKDFHSGKSVNVFKIGDIVKIIDGPSKGQTAPILEIDDSNKVAVVELVLFDRKTPVEMEYKYLEIK